MPKLYFLGTATNVPDENHENTHFALVGENRVILIDGPANPYSRMLQAKIDVSNLTDIVMTHFHPDHVAGIPLLLMSMGLSGRKEPLNIYANKHCMDNMHDLLEAFEWKMWHFFPVELHILPEVSGYRILTCDEFSIYSTPVKHFIPTIGLRIEIAKSGKVIAYSGDTAPTDALFGLAKNADILIHEAAGESAGHSSARQAGELAARAEVKDLYLVHYPVGGYDYQQLAVEAGEVFKGKVVVAEDFDVIEL